MKKRIISLLLALLLVAGLVPQLAVGAEAAQLLSAAPYAGIVYEQTANVQAGTIRYISQLTSSPLFKEYYWRDYVDGAGHECLTTSISMALSYIGVNKTPADLGDYWTAKGYQGGSPFTTVPWDVQGTTYSKPTLAEAMQRYVNGGGKYSPPVLHLTSYSANGHYVVVAGQIDAKSYLIVDPATDAPWVLRLEGDEVVYPRSGSERRETLDTGVIQYFNANASAPRMHANGTACPAGKFVDVPSEKDWSHAGIDFCVTSGLMNGVDSTHIDPSGQMTRAMLVTVLYRAAGMPSYSNAVVPFTDLQADWYRPAVTWAYINGITSGVSGTRFDPNGKVTREQLVAMLYRFHSVMGQSVNVGNADSLSGFSDVASVSDYAKVAFYWAVNNGLVNGVSATQLQPQGGANRAQIATILMRYSNL